MRRELAILAARVAVGIVFFAHGWQKLVTNGYDATASGFADMGIPLPRVAALLNIAVELAGGAALIAGVAVPIVGLFLAVNMAGAFVLVHIDQGFFVADGGFEFVLVLGVASLLMAATGAGRFSIDYLFTRRAEAGAPARRQGSLAGER